ncbi:hypothetical protein [Flavobacterium sp.]|uniref:hypothetical protein n=1 Tax=Flavobacterium sp. TaxID=239 RepID=UPI0037522497
MKLINSKSIVFFAIAFISNPSFIFSQDNEDAIAASEDATEYAKADPIAANIDNYHYVVICLAVLLMGYYFFKFSNQKLR